MKQAKRNHLLSVILTAGVLALTAPAFADHDDDSDSDWDSDDRRRSVSVAAYGSHGARHGHRRGARYDYARVVRSEPIIRYVTIRRPVRDCWQDVEYYTVERPAPGVGASTLAGAVVGGVIGHQFGSGRGNDAATVAGSLIGAAIGNDSARRRGGYVVEEHSRPVRRCETHMREFREERIDGYRVTYRYKGKRYRTRLPYDPGRELRVRVDVRPVG